MPPFGTWTCLWCVDKPLAPGGPVTATSMAASIVSSTLVRTPRAVEQDCPPPAVAGSPRRTQHTWYVGPGSAGLCTCIGRAVCGG